MGVVKYTGPMASFHCPTNAEIRSLKVHFSPKQEGSGDPSPENVREIVGWDGVEIYHNNSLYCDGDYPYIVVPDGIKVGDKIVAYVKQPEGITGEHGFMGVQGTTGNSFELYYLGSVLKVWPSDMTLINTEYGDIDVITCKATVAKTNPYKIGVYRTNAYKYTGYIYRVTIYNSAEEKIRDFIPYKQNDVIGFYDNVKKEFFAPASESKFKNYTGEITNYEFGVLGKNKFDYANANIIDKKRRDDNGNIVSDATGSYCQTLIPVRPNVTYTISGYPVNNSSKRIYYIDANEDFIERTATFCGSNYTFTTPNNCYYIQIQNREVGKNASWETLQLELGSTATAYEPYDPKHTVYGGWVDLISGEVTQEWTEPLTLSEPYYYGGNVCFGYTYPSKYTPYPSNLPSERIISALNKSTFSINTKNHFIFGYDNTFEKTDGNGNLNPEWTNWYNSLETKPTISLRLYESITYHIAPTQLQTFLGQNNVWSNADYVEVEYDLHETQDILARKNFIIANQPHVEEASGAIATFTTDMAAKLKECRVHFSPVQEGSGDPSPENVRPITGWTGCEVWRTGKNLIDESYLANGNNYPNAGGYGYFYTNDIYLKPNTRYRFVWYDYDDTALSNFETNIHLYVQGASEYIVNNAKYKQYSSGFLTPSTGIIRLGIYHPRSIQRQDVLDAIFNNGKLLLQIGVEDTSHEPYTGTAIPIDWTDLAGTIYGGYVDLVTGEVVRDWFVNTHEVAATDGTPGGTGTGGNTNYRFIAWNLPSAHLPDTNRTTQAICNIASYSTQVGGTRFWIGGGTVYMVLPNDSQAYSAIVVYAERDLNVSTYQLSSNELKTLRGTNNIWASNGGGNVEIAYWTH